MKHDTKCGLRIYRGSNEWPKVELRRVVAAISGCFSVFLNCVSHVAISDASSKGAAGARLSPSTSHFERRAAKRVLTVRGKIPPVPVPTCARIPLASAAVVDTDPAPRARLCFVATDRIIGGRQPRSCFVGRKNWAGWCLEFQKKKLCEVCTLDRRTFRPLCPPLGGNKSLASNIRP